MCNGTSHDYAIGRDCNGFTLIGVIGCSLWSQCHSGQNRRRARGPAQSALWGCRQCRWHHNWIACQQWTCPWGSCQWRCWQEWQCTDAERCQWDWQFTSSKGMLVCMLFICIITHMIYTCYIYTWHIYDVCICHVYMLCIYMSCIYAMYIYHM